jgi:hypothetical protein
MTDKTKKYQGPERRLKPRPDSRFQKLLDVSFEAARKLEQPGHVQSEHWPFLVPTAHRLYWEQRNCAHVYEYDPTDDGPEVGTIRAIIDAHPPLEFLTRELLKGYAEHKAERAALALLYVREVADALRN